MNVSASIRMAVLAAALCPFISGKGAAPEASSSSTAEFGYVGGGDLSQGSVKLGEVDSLFTRVRHVRSIPVNRRYSWRIGGEWERIGFGIPAAAPVPNTLQSVQLHLGNTWFINPKAFLQFEVDPGIYSDFEDIDFGDFNAPVSARLIYLQNTNVQWVAAFIGNLKSELPVVGGVGLRWRFAPDWTLDLILPRPQVRYDFSDRLTIHAGAEMKGGAYRVAEDFGTRTGRPQLNDEDVTYREARVGGGFKWKLNEKITAVVDGGWLIDRRFKFEDRRLQLNGDGAPYFQFALKAKY
jgi:hypothetical protein